MKKMPLGLARKVEADAATPSVDREITLEEISEEIFQRLIANLEQSRELMDKRNEGWKLHLLRSLRDFLLTVGVERRLWTPVHRMMLDENDLGLKERARLDGSRPMKIEASRASILSILAASVSALKDHSGTVDAAARDVATASGIAKTEITKFRDNIHRGKCNPDSGEAYRKTLENISTWKAEEILSLCRHLSLIPL